MDIKEVKIDVEDFKRKMEVDKNMLDVQWEEHAEIYFQYVEISSACSQVIDGLKDELSVAEAEKDFKLRSNPDKYGIEKVTNDVVKAFVAKDKKLAEKRQEIQEWMYYDRILRGALTSIEHRKRALTKLSDLYIAGYYSAPKVGEPVKKETEKRAKGEVKKTLKKSKRMTDRSKK